MKKFYKCEDKLIYNAKNINFGTNLDHYFMHDDHIEDIINLPYIMRNRITKVRLLFAQLYI